MNQDTDTATGNTLHNGGGKGAPRRRKTQTSTCIYREVRNIVIMEYCNLTLLILPYSKEHRTIPLCCFLTLL